jgi:hypothetical protein
MGGDLFFRKRQLLLPDSVNRLKIDGEYPPHCEISIELTNGALIPGTNANEMTITNICSKNLPFNLQILGSGCDLEVIEGSGN